MNMILNLAVGSGNGPCPAIPSSFQSASMQIDYVRFYKRLNCNQVLSFTNITELNLNSNLTAYNFIVGSQITISSDIQLGSDQNLNIIASNRIELSPGFSALKGSNFTAKIKPNLCTDIGMRKKQTRFPFEHDENTKPQDLNKSIDPPIVNNQEEINNTLNVEFDSLNYHIFPNPSQNTLNINFKKSTSNYKLILFDSHGAKLYERIHLNSNESINLINYQNGIYYLVVIDEEDKSIFTNKIIKQ